MINLYAKKCCWCKVVVPAGMGKVWNYNGRWIVGCQDCINDKFNDSDDNDGDQLPNFFCYLHLGMVNTIPKFFYQIYFFICTIYNMCYTIHVRSQL